MRTFAVLLAALLAAASTAGADCTLTSTGNVPLPDTGEALYLGEWEGGLYPGGETAPPRALRRAANRRGRRIEPLDRFGVRDPEDGAIVLLSVGMSNTRQEFDAFAARMAGDPSVNPRLVLVNGAQGGRAAEDWADPGGEPWERVGELLDRLGLTPEQVQVAWIKQAERRSAQLGGFPAHAEVLQEHLEAIARNLRLHYPNLSLVYLSSRTRAWTEDPRRNSPEPEAYESGFAVKWAIGRQLAGASDLNPYSARGEVVAPLMLWGPYLWADGLEPRSDGFTWRCADTRAGEYVHPSRRGRRQVARQLEALFKTDPSAAGWFLRPEPVGQPPQAGIFFELASGRVPFVIDLGAGAFDPDGEVVSTLWSFDDGTFSTSPTPTKTYHRAGVYRVRLTVTDDDGNAVRRKLRLRVRD